jgi:predicted membrane protein
MTAGSDSTAASRLHWPSLLVGLLIMVGGTIYPLWMANSAGKVDHLLAMLLFWAMSAGFVRGVGFVPHVRVLRWLFSGRACAAALLAAAALRIAG